MIQDKIFLDEKDPTGLSYNTPFTVYGSYQGRLWSKTPSGSIQYYSQNSDLSAYATTGSNQFNGSQTITGSLTVTGGISGSSAESASYALNADKIDNLDSTQLVLTSSFNSYTSSASSSVGSLSSSVATTTSGLGGRITTIEGNYATTGSNTFIGSQVITGSLYITTDLIVQGSSSLQNITASAVSIGTNTVILNTDTPAVRFAGISVQDSGSNVGVTGSIFWDGLCNRWVYSNPSGIGYSGGMLLSGPRTSTLGTESPLTCNYIAKSGGGDHLYDSCVIDDGTTVCVNANLKGSGTACFTGQVCGPNFIASSTCSTATLRMYGASGTHQWDMYLNGANLRISDNTTTNGYFVVDTSATFGGYLGVGVSTPLTKLHLYDSSPNYILLTNTGADGVSNAIQGGIIGQSRGYSNNLAQMGSILFRNKNTAAWYKGEITFSTNDSDGTNPAISPVERMRISSDGNVGIGTVTPSTPLQILRDTTGNGTNIEESNMALTVLSTAGQSKISIGASNAGNYGYIQVMQDATSWTNRNLTLQPRGGNVGIGTYTPDRLLTINGDSTLLGNNYLSTSKFLQWEGGAYWTTRVTSTGNQFEIYRGDTGASPLVISNCNKIGIGATSPRWLLEICANNACGGAGHYPAISINNVCSNGYSAYYFYKGADQMGGMEMSNGTGNLLINSPTTFTVQTSGTNRLSISGGGACFGVDSHFCGSTYGIMGLGAKVHEGTYYTMTGPSTVITLPITYGSASSIYLFGSLLGNDSMHYAHMMYYYRNDFYGFQGSTITQMSCYNTSTAGQRYTFSIVDPGGLGKSSCPIKINITCANGPDVGAGSYCTRFKIVVYNV